MNTSAQPDSSAEPPAAPDFETQAKAVDDAVAGLAALDEDSRRVAEAVKAAIEGFHRPGLVHIVQTLKGDPRGKELLFELVDAPAVRAIFGLHGIIKADPLTRARQALDEVRPYLQSHGGDVTVERIADGAAYVRLQGSCNGCSMSSVTLRDTVAETLVARVEEVDRIEVLDDEPTTAFIPLSAVGRKPVDTGWAEGPTIEALSAQALNRFDLDGDSFIITNLDNRLAVFRNACVHQGKEIDGGMIDEGMLVCPWHGFRFDASTGECISAPGAQLEAVPSRVEDGHLWIRVRGTASDWAMPSPEPVPTPSGANTDADRSADSRAER